MKQAHDDVTGLLHRAADGDADANDELFAQIYSALRILAHRQLNAHRGGTLCTTALVNEALVKLLGSDSLSKLDDRRHLFATAARAMHQILVDYARQRFTQKRGGAWKRLSLEEDRIEAASLPDQILSLDAALAQLQDIDERGFRVVELKFFGGLTTEEIAGHLGVSGITVKRDWRRSRAFLYAEMVTP